MADKPLSITGPNEAITCGKQPLVSRRALQFLDLSAPEETGKGQCKLARRRTIGVPREEPKSKKPDAGRSTSKFTASVGRLIVAEQVTSAFKNNVKLEDVSLRVITAYRWLFMDARKELMKRKEEEHPKNPKELLRLVFQTIRQAIHRQELKRRVANVFWEALVNKKAAQVAQPKTVLPAILTSQPPKPATAFVIACKLNAVREAQDWIAESDIVWQQRREQRADMQKQMGRMKALKESSQNHLDVLTNLKHQIESGLLSAKVIQKSMVHLMSQPWLVEHLTQKQEQLQDALQALNGADDEKNEERGENRDEDVEKEEASVEEPDELREHASIDVGSKSGCSVCVSTAASEDPSSCGGQRQPVQRTMPQGSMPAKAKTPDSSKLSVPKQSAIQSTSKNSITSDPEVLESTQPVVEAEGIEEFRNKCLKDLALVESIWNEFLESSNFKSAADSSSEREDSSSPGVERLAPAATPVAEQSREPLIAVTQPDDFTHHGVEVAKPTFLVQHPAESDEQQMQTKKPAIAEVQHGRTAITMVAQESIAVPLCSRPVLRTISKSGARQLIRRSSIRCLEVPSDDKCGSNRPIPWASRKAALTPWTSMTDSGHTKDAPRRSSSKITSCVAEEAPRKSLCKMPSRSTEEVPRRSDSKTALSHTGEGPRRFSAKKSRSLNDMDAAESPECRDDSLTKVQRHECSNFPVSRTSVRQSTTPVEQHDALPLVAGIPPNYPCTNQRDLSTSSDSSGQEEQTLHSSASKRLPTLLLGGRQHLNQQLPSLDSLEDCSVSDMRAASRSSSKRSSETPIISGVPTLSQSLSAGWLPARDGSSVQVVGSIRDFRRLPSKQAFDSGTGLQTIGSGQAASKDGPAKDESSTLSAERMRRRASSLVLLRSPCRLVPDTDCSGLLVKGAKLMRR